MFEIKSKGSNGWKTITSLLSAINDECTFTVKPDGIDFKCMDIDTSAMVDCLWKADTFDKWQVTEETKVGLRLLEFSKIMNRVKDEDIELNQDDNKMIVNIGELKTYDVPLIHTEDRTPNSPKAQYKAVFDIKLSDLKEKLEDIRFIKAFAEISVENGKVTFAASEQTEGKGKSILPVDIKVDEKIIGEYSIDHLLNAISAVSKTIDTCKISMSNKMPMKAEFNIPDMGIINYYLAPFVVR